MPPKNFLEGSDQLKLAVAFCNVFGRHFAGNREQLPVTCARETTIASYGTSRFIEGPVAGERGLERTKERSSFM